MDDKENLDPELQKELDDAYKRLKDSTKLDTAYRQMVDTLGNAWLGFNSIFDRMINADVLRTAFDPIQKMIDDWKVVYDALKPHFDAVAKEDPHISIGACTLKAVLRAESMGEQLPDIVMQYMLDNLPGFDGTQSVTDFVAERRARQAEAGTEQEPLTDEEKEKIKLERIRKTKELSKQVRESNISSIPKWLPVVAEKSMGFDMFTRKIVKELPKEVIEKAVDPETGLIRINDPSQPQKTVKELIKEINGNIESNLLIAMFGIAYQNKDWIQQNSSNSIVAIYLPEFFKKFEIDPRQYVYDSESGKPINLSTEYRTPMAQARWQKFSELIGPLYRYAAWYGNSLYQIVGFQSYDRDAETVYLSMPYMFKLAEEAIGLRSGEALRKVFRAGRFLTGVSPVAAEVANRIAMGLIARGPDPKPGQKRLPQKTKRKITHPDGTKETIENIYQEQPESDKKVTIRIYFQTIVNDCPELKRELEKIDNAVGPLEQAARAARKPPNEIAAARKQDHKTDPQRRNKKLKDVFSAAIDILMNRTIARNYYQDLRIETEGAGKFVPPTYTRLNSILKITHYGKNPNYDES